MPLRDVATRLRPYNVSEPDSCGRQTPEFDRADDLLRQPAPRPWEFSGVRHLWLGFPDGRLACFRVLPRGLAAEDVGRAPKMSLKLLLRKSLVLSKSLFPIKLHIAVVRDEPGSVR